MKPLILIGLLSLCKYCGALSTEPEHGYMTHFYFNGKTIHVNDSMLLELTTRLLPAEPDRDYLTCNVRVVTSPGRRLMLHFLSLQISDQDNAIDRLHVFDYEIGGKEVRLSPVQGLYGLYDTQYQGASGRVDDYTSTANTLQLDYQGKPTLAYDGFKILITSFRDGKGDCGREFVRCSEGLVCVPVSTWCDGYNNCGVGDTSDEEVCNHDLHNTWTTIDGQVTAVVTTAVSCTIFLITAAVIAITIIKINKRDIIHNSTTITVGFRKRKGKKKAGDARADLSRLYAPPSYQVVIGMDESPPPYQSDEYDTETDTDSAIVDHVTGNNTRACAVNSEHDTEHKGNRTNAERELNVTSALVECQVENETEKTHSNIGFEDLTKYRVCSSEDEHHANTVCRNARVRGAIDLDEIEVLPCEQESQDALNRNIQKTHADKHKSSLSHFKNGHAGKQNGAVDKCNGHSKVSYTKSADKHEDASIEHVHSV